MARRKKFEVRYADPEEVTAQAASWSDEQVVCRLRKHRFTVPVEAILYERHGWYYTRMACAGGCGVELIEHANWRGHVFLKHYDYSKAPGYLSKTGRIAGDARDALNLVHLTRVVKPRKSRKDIEPHSSYEE